MYATVSSAVNLAAIATGCANRNSYKLIQQYGYKVDEIDLGERRSVWR
jgi:hypothetical protein